MSTYPHTFIEYESN